MASNYEKLTALGIHLRRHSGQEKVTCPKCSHTRRNKKDPCLSVNIDTGVYNCHNPGCEFRGTVVFFQEKKVYAKPAEWSNYTQLSEKLVKWFKDRGISQQTLIEAKITEGKEWMPQKNAEANTVQFNYFRSGELINVKFRTADKCFKMFSGAELIFYNLDGIKDATEALIVEGEIDAISFIEAGYKTVVSVPNGASKGSQKLEYLDNCWNYFDEQKITKIYIGVDNDEAGNSLRDELVRRLGDERCYLVDYKDCKDGNEYLLKYGPESLTNLIQEAKQVPIEGIFTADKLNAEVVELYNNGLPPGDFTGLEGLDELISFLKGQLTMVTGIPNHGKSDFLDQICERLAVIHSWRFGVFSPENFPIALHLSKLIEKLIGKPFGSTLKMSVEELQQAMAFIQDYFFFIRPKDENYTLENILEKARKLILKYGINALIIDPWNTLEHFIPPGISETNYVSHQLAKIISFKQRYNVHVFLVAHPTKIKKDKNTGKYDIPTLYDISGSANFFNKTDNGICVYRDFDEKITIVSVQKVKFRHLGQVGQTTYKYDVENGRYNGQGQSFDRKNHLKEKPTVTNSKQESVYESQSTLFDQRGGDDMPF